MTLTPVPRCSCPELIEFEGRLDGKRTYSEDKPLSYALVYRTVTENNKNVAPDLKVLAETIEKLWNENIGDEGSEDEALWARVGEMDQAFTECLLSARKLVTKITCDLSKAKYIPPKLFAFFPHVQEVSFQKSLFSEIPPEITQAKKITSLTFSNHQDCDCKLQELPACIGTLKSLQTLQITSTNITKLPIEAIGRWEKLSFINISNNKIGPKGLVQLSALKGLVQLVARNNQIKLRQSNDLIHKMEDFKKIKDLRVIDLSSDNEALSRNVTQKAWSKWQGTFTGNFYVIITKEDRRLYVFGDGTLKTRT